MEDANSDTENEINNFNVAEMMSASDASDDSDSDMENGDEDDGNQAEVDNDGQKAYIPGQEELEEGEELVMDENAYIVYHQAHLGPPCLSFDIIPDDLGKIMK